MTDRLLPMADHDLGPGPYYVVVVHRRRTSRPYIRITLSKHATFSSRFHVKKVAPPSYSTLRST